VNLTTGTLNAGTINIGTVVGKDANAVAQTGNPISFGGTDSGGTVRTVLVNSAGALSVTGASAGTFVNISTGTLTTGSLSNVAMVNAGTISMINAGTLGTITNLGSVTNIGQIYNAGTLQTGANTIGNIGTLITGTLLSSGTSTGVGTITNIGSVTNLGQLYNAGTVQNQLAGTLTALQNGTITAGTINTGTLSPIPTIANVTYGTHGTTGVSIFGTLAGGTGSGAGTEIFITSLSLTVPSTGGSQDTSIGWGTNGGTFHAGTGLLVRGNFPPGGGIQKTFWPPVNSGTQAQLCLFQAGAGTVDVSVTYFITPSIL
jgi:hypothetical protein